MVAVIVAVPAAVVWRVSPERVAPVVPGDSMLQMMDWLVASLGSTVAVRMSGKVAVAVSGTFVTFVTGTYS